MNNPQYEIYPSTKGSLSSYNRYPFASYDEAVNNLKQKSLQPGEMAIAYYFDQDSIIGINAALAFGNLKKQENIIFKNPELYNEEVLNINKELSNARCNINKIIDAINHSNKIYSEIADKVNDLDEKMNETHDTLYVQMLDLNTYNLDLE